MLADRAHAAIPVFDVRIAGTLLIEPDDDCHGVFTARLIGYRHWAEIRLTGAAGVEVVVWRPGVRLPAMIHRERAADMSHGIRLARELLADAALVEVGRQ